LHTVHDRLVVDGVARSTDNVTGAGAQTSQIRNHRHSAKDRTDQPGPFSRHFGQYSPRDSSRKGIYCKQHCTLALTSIALTCSQLARSQRKGDQNMRPKYLLTLLVLLALAVASAPTPAQAGGIVSVCDEANLLAALAGGGTVTFSCSGTITLTAEITIAADTTIDGSGQAIILSGNHTVRVFTVNSGVTLNLNELTIANGSTPDNGGGISNWGGTVTVNNSTFAGNSAVYGAGGIYNWDGGTLTVSNCTFAGNSTGGSRDIYIYGGGGAISNFGAKLTVSNSSFSANSAGFIGGGIYNWYGGALTVSNSTFSGNSSLYGGGIYNGGALTVTNSTFSGNSADNGGGIYNYWEGSTVVVNSSTFSANSASSQYGGGGAIYNYRGTLTVSNSTFDGNSATNYGGGIYNDFWGTLSVSNSTFSGNSATRFAGGIFNSYGAPVTLQNTIVANSPAGGNCSASITDDGGNLSYPDTTCPGINGNPVLGPLQDNGGPTRTMALLLGSAALDAADDAICAAAPVNNRDQRGISRPQGPHCDIGAYEAMPPRAFLPIIMR
jgi:hypothetical protein